ncbi:MAG TPA: FAD-binding oxidoreductase [Steroidobacteraceae bacterium]|nr:FAD-binding oxidoreductase [Steroidobacteraceae bacterium]
MAIDELLPDLRAIVGDEGLVMGDRLRERAKGLDEGAGEVRARFLVRPRDAPQVSAILRLCNSRKQIVVTHGGVTGLVYGCAAGVDDLILSLEALNRIEGVDVAGRTLRVEAGVTLQRAQEEAERHDLMFPLDLGGRATATIGGNISTNAGGMRVIRYGMMRSLVLGVEAVLADGTVLGSLNRMLKNNAGYDLKQLFIGTEGTLGVVTRADLRLVPRPRSHGTAFVACPDFKSLARLLSLMDSRLGGQLSAFEVMWPEYYELVTKPVSSHAALLPHGLGVYVLIEALGADQQSDTERLERALAEALEAGLVADAVIAKSDLERRAMWAPREAVFETRRLGPTHNFDVSLAIADMPDYLDALRRRLAEIAPGARLIVFGHIADGNLHIIVAAGDRHAATFDAVERCVYEPLRSIAGSISAEHGIGLERKAFLGISRSPAELALMRTLKATLDPNGILNPGKVIDVPPA